ncbi:MAG: 30S ribosomal protein S2 [Deltaproteobacteria bacterium]|nr:30S ribosomal protein S2 [Deltaproteobacteria bacterium]
MAYLTMKQLLESGVHFGHQTKRWNPKMKTYIYGARNGIYIIDLQQTVKLFKEAYDFIKSTTAKGGKVLFIGTKKQAHNAINEESTRCGMGYVNNRWIGGFLTNFATIKKSINRLKELDNMDNDPAYASATKKESLMFKRERDRLEKYLGGVRELNGVPAVLFIIDSKKESIAIKEARRLGIKVVAIVDTNCDPDEVDYVIPGNDDAIRAIKLFSSSVADACLEGKAIYEESLQARTDKKDKEKAFAETVAAAAVKPEEAARPSGAAAAQ